MAVDRLTLALTRYNGALTQLSLDFNSLVEVDGKVYGFNDSGMYLLSGDDDAGADRAAWFEIYHDFGMTVRLRSFVFNVQAWGQLTVNLTWDDSLTSEYALTPITMGVHHLVKLFTSPHVDRGQYMRMRVTGSNVDYSVDSILANVIGLGSRRVM